MIGQNDIKRQVRYKDSIYDILKDITLGNHKYLMIGKVSDGKFYDIDFVEQKLENDKVKYVSPNFNYQFNVNNDFTRLQGQALMNYIINQIKDKINQGILISYNDTMNYIDKIKQIVDNNNDIRGFFVNSGSYVNEEQFDESIKTLLSYYDKEIKNYHDSEKLPNAEVLVSDETVKEIYDELENTQNFGVSAIYDYENKKSEENYIKQPVGDIFTDISKTIEPNIEKSNNDNNIDNIEENKLEQEENKPLSFQERLYLENEKKMREREQIDLQTDLVKTKTLTLTKNNSRMNNAAYITISALIYLIGSFELLLSLILIAKYL